MSRTFVRPVHRATVPLWLLAAIALITPTAAWGGSIFVTGHDPDFHASQGPNTTGAANINKDALTFARNGNTAPILFIEDSPPIVPGGHADGELGLVASGYTAGTTPGNHYVKVDAAGFTAANLSLYSAIYVQSDFGGILSGNDLEALNKRSADLINYLNAGGGLVALAEDGLFPPPTDGSSPKIYGFLPFLVTSSPLDETETGNTVTPFGASLGLLNSDVNGNFSHTVFTATGGMNVVDVDAGGEILSLGYRGLIGTSGVVPEPSALVLGLTGALGVALIACRRSARDSGRRSSAGMP
jgi:hypothetical protein